MNFLGNKIIKKCYERKPISKLINKINQQICVKPTHLRIPRINCIRLLSIKTLFSVFHCLKVEVSCLEPLFGLIGSHHKSFGPKQRMDTLDNTRPTEKYSYQYEESAVGSFAVLRASYSYASVFSRKVFYFAEIFACATNPQRH